jgi:hypothetical protein
MKLIRQIPGVNWPFQLGPVFVALRRLPTESFNPAISHSERVEGGEMASALAPSINAFQVF